MINITYNPDTGMTLPDGKVKEWVDQVIADFKKNRKVSVFHVVGLDSIINEFRIRVAKKEITPDDIEFYFERGDYTTFIVEIDEKGIFDLSPVGFNTFTQMQALELLSAMVR